ncbi:hypothetical protein A4X13_0g7994 [Tilletia indica]|uniref:Uncharacterized protein n=1 Tax=Tilletia indica TaxID=43049 RepID=A0A177T537_9BASI|nr:hypothetical protein A4X13_0g7994 [Tilletia indica]
MVTQKNQKARKWRKKSLWYYVRVSDLCSEAVANGEFALDPALGSPDGDLGADDDEEVEDADDDSADEDKKGKKRAVSSSTTTQRPKKRQAGSDQFDRMIDVLSEMVDAEAGPSRARVEDPVEAATRVLLEMDADEFEADDVARLIGHFAANAGSARAYVTLAISQTTTTAEIRGSYLQQILAGIMLV